LEYQIVFKMIEMYRIQYHAGLIVFFQFLFSLLFVGVCLREI